MEPDRPTTLSYASGAARQPPVNATLKTGSGGPALAGAGVVAGSAATVAAAALWGRGLVEIVLAMVAVPAVSGAALALAGVVGLQREWRSTAAVTSPVAPVPPTIVAGFGAPVPPAEPEPPPS